MTNELTAGRAANPTGGTIKATNKPTAKTTADTEITVVFGTRMLAAGTANFDWILVKDCCWCGFAHRHLMFERDAHAIERSPSCAPHRSYQVRIADVVPARRQWRAA